MQRTSTLTKLFRSIKMIGFILVIVFVSKMNLNAQVAISSYGSAPDASAMLDVSSTNKGLLIPRMSTTERNNIPTPAMGLMVYDNTTNSFWFYGGSWKEVGPSTKLIDNDGDTRIDMEENVDEDKIRFYTDSTQRMLIDNQGDVVIGEEGNTRIQLKGAGGQFAISEFNSTETSPRWSIGRDLLNPGQAGIGFGFPNTAFFGEGAQIGINNPRSMSFYTGDGTTRVERMRIGPDGNIIIGNMNAQSSAILNLESTTKGLLPPRMIYAEIDAIQSPANGLMVYCTDCKGGAGEMLTFASGNWSNFNAESSGLPYYQLGLDIDGEAVYNNSGSAVALSSDGNRVAIGAEYNDGNGYSSGHVRIYDWNGSTWVQIGQDIDGEAVDDWSGSAVALSSDGNRVAIGAVLNDGNGSYSGHVRIYDWNGSTWVQIGQDIDGEAADDRAGSAVALSSDGNRVAIGAVLNDGNGSNSGHVRIYDWNGSTWVQLGLDIDGEEVNERSGSAVALSSDGNRVAIGAEYNDGNGSSSGHVRIYEWNGSTWVQLGLDIDGESWYDRSGSAVALSSDGNRVAIGALENNGNGSNSGHVRIYDWNGSTWVQIGLDIDGEAADDNSGGAVALSSDGNRVAIGAEYNDGNGIYSGHVRIYDWNGSTWVQLGLDIDGEAVGNNSGSAVALSSDGNRVAIGAVLNDGNGWHSGHVRIYNR